MWNGWLNQTALPALEQTTVFAQRRHLLLAGNIANLDTPGYQTRDLSVAEFQNALKEVVEAQQARSSMPGSASSPHHTLPEAVERTRDVTKQVLYHDGSDVSLEEQVAEISKNQAMHDMAVALMRSQFQTLNMAIRESVNV
ncbi:MAG: flagellar biosynthesis protein FlgB [Pirellulaceae bacterium]|nr:MAG: flagellar biosynthesis protein FlgB [Pirellulaceae bacterium]